MEQNRCKNCVHFYQHYALNQKKIFRVNCGHCVFTKPKKQLPDSAACEHFTLGELDEAAFVSKEYLSKELLRYVLHLELLPQIQDAK